MERSADLSWDNRLEGWRGQLTDLRVERKTDRERTTDLRVERTTDIRGRGQQI